MASPTIGIDLGTTKLCVASYADGQLSILETNTGNRVMSTAIAFPESGRIVGDEAKARAVMNPLTTRMHPLRMVAEGQESWALQYKGRNLHLSVFEVMAMLLIEARATAQRHLGTEIARAVVVVPCDFSLAQREALRAAGRIAHLDVDLLTSPSAAALAYAHNARLAASPPNPHNSHTNTNTQRLFVFDLGSGSLDLSLLTYQTQAGVFRVESSLGRSDGVGGMNYDQRLLDYCVSEFVRVNAGITEGAVRSNARSRMKLWKACEKAKRDLSLLPQTTLSIDCLYQDLDFTLSLSRALLNSLTQDLQAQALHLVARTLTNAHLNPSEVDAVLLIGGASRVPGVQLALKEYFGKDLCRSVNPDEACALGAALYCAALEGQRRRDPLAPEWVVFEPLSRPLGVRVLAGDAPGSLHEALPGVCLVPCREPLPLTHTAHLTVPAARARAAVDAQVELYEGTHTDMLQNQLLGTYALSARGSEDGLATLEAQLEANVDGSLRLTLASATDRRVHAVELPGSLSARRVLSLSERLERLDADERAATAGLEAKNRLEERAYAIRSRLNERTRTPAHIRRKIEVAVQNALDWIEAHPDEEASRYERLLAQLDRQARQLV